MTLTEAAYWTRRLGVLGVGGFFLIVCGISGYLILLDIRNPEAETVLTPDYACTTSSEEFLEERLIIPSLQLSTGSTEIIEIDTPTGQADSLPPVANVFEYNHSGPSLIAQKKAQDIGRKLGFDPERIKRRGTIEYYWDEDQYGRRLSINANTLNYKLDTNFINPRALPESKVLPSNDEAKQLATNFMRGNGWLLEDYAESEPLVTLINIEPDGSYSMAQSRAEAELIRVDFYRAKPFLMFRSDITNADSIRSTLEEDYLDYEFISEKITTPEGGIEIYSFMAEVVHQDTQKSNISVFIGPEYKRDLEYDAPEDVYAVDYTSWTINEEPCGTYPLLSTSTVESLIKNDEASLVYINEINGDTVIPYQQRTVTNLTVKQITLAYLDTPDQQRFLQPIYIVQGDATLENGVPGRFYFYMPAINYDFLKDPVLQQTPTEEGSENNTDLLE